MDEIDLIIQQKLLVNSRLTFRELAEITNISVSAVHKRIKKLEEDNIITAYIARPSILVLNCLAVVIYGSSNAKSMDTISEEIGQHESIISVAVASGKFLYISAQILTLVMHARVLSILGIYPSFFSKFITVIRSSKRSFKSYL